MNINTKPGQEVQSYQTDLTLAKAEEITKPLFDIAGADVPLVSAVEPKEKRHHNPRQLKKGPHSPQQKATVSYNIDKCIAEAIEDHAIEEDIVKSRIVNKALKEYIERHGLQIDYDKYRNDLRKK
jgi:hypothetical protein